MVTNEFGYKILKLLETAPSMSQRDLARDIGISLGKVNYCLNALIEKGLIKVENFRKSKIKKSYLYLLTPHGIKEKSKIALDFLKQKLTEYEFLKQEIEQLQQEINNE